MCYSRATAKTLSEAGALRSDDGEAKEEVEEEEVDTVALAEMEVEVEAGAEAMADLKTPPEVVEAVVEKVGQAAAVASAPSPAYSDDDSVAPPEPPEPTTPPYLDTVVEMQDAYAAEEAAVRAQSH
jgi:hypothetical protein